jgi:methionine-rich copper-binding protein CopC
VSVTPLPQPVSVGSFTPSCIDAGTASWTNPSVVNTIVVFAKAGGAVNVGSPTANISTYTAATSFGVGTPYENDTDAFCVYKGSGTSENIGSLTANTNYHFLIFNVDGTIYSSAHQFNNSTPTGPPNVTGLANTPSDGTLSINWTNPACADEVIMVARAGSPATGSPSGNGSAYSTNLNFSTAAAANFDASARVVFKGTASPQVITNLTNGTAYHVTIYTRKGSTWSAGATTVGTPVDNVDPTLTSFNPTDGSTNVASDANLVIAFSEAVQKGSGNIRIRRISDNSDVTGSPISVGGANVTVTGNTVTIDPPSDLPAGTAVYVNVANTVFDDLAGNSFAGFTDNSTWNFTTSAGVTVTPGTGAANTATFTPLSDIIIAENGTNDFASGSNRTIKLELNGGGYIFDTSGSTSVTFTAGRNITAASFTMDFTSITVTYSVTGTNLLDEIRITNLAVKTSSTGNPVRNINRVSSGGSEATIVGSTAAIGQTFATVTSCATVSPVLAFTGAITELCQGSSLTGINVNATGSGSIRWYANINLTGEFGALAGNTSPSATALGFSTTSPATIRRYATLTSGCQSAPTAVTLTINPLPVADAGMDGSTFCSGLLVGLGGSPTLATESSPGAYIYSWTDLSGNFTAPIANSSNPDVTISNNSGSTLNYQFQVTITDSKNCSDTDVKTLSVTTSPFAYLTNPSTNFFSPSSSEQLLEAEPSGGVFTGIGVVQTGPGEYKFSPTLAYNETQPLPQNLPIKYTGVDVNGCPVVADPIVTMTLSDQAFAISSEYCSTERPYSPGSGIKLRVPASLNVDANNFVTSWNSTQRLNRYPFTSPPFIFGGTYNLNDKVVYLDNVYRATVPISPAFGTPDSDVRWELYATLEISFEGDFRNFYEGFYGGNIGDPTLLPTATSYTLGSDTYSEHEFFTNPNYTRCSGCSFLLPAIYVRMARAEDIRFFLPAWNPLFTYRPGQLVRFGPTDRVYEMTNSVNIVGGGTPDSNPFFWTDRTNANYDNGSNYKNGSNAGFQFRNQFVQINQVPQVTFSGLSSTLPNADDFCNVNQSITLTGSVIGSGVFTGSADGISFASTTGLQSGAPSPGRATFNPETVFSTLGGGTNPRNFYVKYTFDTQETGGSGQACLAESNVVAIEIYPLPSISFSPITPPSATVFCYNETPAVLTASESSGVVYTGLGVTNTAAGQGAFNPTQAYTQRETELGATQTTAQNFDVTVTYTNTIGCSQSTTRNYQVRPLPPATFDFGNKTTYCYEDNNQSFTSLNPSGRYQLLYVREPAFANEPVDAGLTQNYLFDPSFIFDQAVAEGASPLSTPTIRVIFTTNDPVKTTCTNTQVTDMIVAPVIPVTIAGFNSDNEIYCSNESARSLTLTPANGQLRINGALQTILNGPSSAFYQFNQPAGFYDIKYAVTTGTSCTSTDSVKITLAPSPVANFVVTPRCEGDLITFDAVDNPNNKIWTWAFVDSIRSGTTLDNLPFRFPGSGSFTVKLRVDADPFGPGNLICRDSVERTQIVGLNPDVTFSFANVCQGDETEFEVNATIAPIDRVRWNFRDGDVTSFGGTSAALTAPDQHGGRSSGIYENVRHTFQTESDFDVIVTGLTPTQFGSCADSDTIRVSILRNIQPNPSPSAVYSMKDLNGGDGFWKVEDINGNSTWEFGTKTNSPVANRIPAWSTNRTGNYLPNDISYVNSPCFDLSLFDKPTLSMQYWVNADNGKDGSILQYSLNGGATWNLVGNLNSGKDWFNENGISSYPPVPENEFGWSGENVNEWRTGKHSLNIIPLPQLSNVRLRVTFRSDERDEFAGFAFGDVRIEQRNRIMLVENFTNASANNAVANATQFDLIPSGETVKIQYHTSFPDNDPLNLLNQSDHNGRAAFYGLAGSIQNSSNLVPRGYIDGVSEGSFLGSWDNDFLGLQSLVSAPVALSVTDEITDPGKLKARVNISALEDIAVNPLKNYRLFIVAIEKQVGTSNKFVMRKMLPDASGLPIPNSSATLLMSKNQVISIATDAISIPGVADASQLALVAFIQEINSKEVVQSALLDPLANPFTIVTGVEPLFSDRIHIYPNPADRELTLELPAPAATSMSLQLIDQLGRVAFSGTLNEGEQKKTISTENAAGGMYFIQIGNGKEAVRKKVLVVHRE